MGLNGKTPIVSWEVQGNNEGGKKKMKKEKGRGRKVERNKNKFKLDDSFLLLRSMNTNKKPRI